MLFFELGLGGGVVVLDLLGLFRGVEAGIGFGDFGTDFGEVGGQFGGEFFDAFRVAGGEVGDFADVFFDVVKFFAAVFVVADEFEVPFADHAGGFAALVAVVWVVPVEGAVGLAAFEGGDEGDAIEVGGGELVESGEVEEGGEEVGAGRELGGGGAGFGDAGGDDVVGLADPAFPLAAFSSAEG